MQIWLREVGRDKNPPFSIELPDDATVSILMERLAQERNLSIQGLRLVYRGLMLKPNRLCSELQTTAESPISYFAKANPAPAPAPAPAPTAVSPPAPTAVSPPAPAAVSTPAPTAVSPPAPAPMTTPAPTPAPAPAPASESLSDQSTTTYISMDEAVNALVGMGFSAEDSRKALRVARGVLDVAVEILLSGRLQEYEELDRSTTYIIPQSIVDQACQQALSHQTTMDMLSRGEGLRFQCRVPDGTIGYFTITAEHVADYMARMGGGQVEQPAEADTPGISREEWSSVVQNLSEQAKRDCQSLITELRMDPVVVVQCYQACEGNVEQTRELLRTMS